MNETVDVGTAGVVTRKKLEQQFCFRLFLSYESICLWIFLKKHPLNIQFNTICDKVTETITKTY